MADEELQTVTDFAGQALAGFKYYLSLKAAFDIARNRKIAAFLKGLDNVVDRLSEGDRATFERYIQSDAGRALLSEYVDAVLRARSTMAVAALAILYGDSERRY